MKSKKLIRNVLVLVAIVLMSTVLCGAGCTNVAAGSSGGGLNPTNSSEVPVKVGDVVMKDGSFKKVSEINDTNKNDAVAVVYKVDGGKAWAVGKVHRQHAWCTDSADASYKKITDLQTNVSGSAGNYTFTGYTDGSTGWDKLKSALGIDDLYKTARYPAWYYCLDYGKDNRLPSTMQNGWYLPSAAEVFEIWRQRATLDASLRAIGGSEFGGNRYVSSSQDASIGGWAYQPCFFNGVWYRGGKINRYFYVCPVRQFTY